MIKYPIVVIVGDFGSGKTLLSTFIGLTYYQQEGLKIFSNYAISGVPKTHYKKITFEQISDIPDWLHDGIILMDETQVGADSYNFLSKSVKQITTFITQIRKRNVVLVMTTQRFDFIAKRIRSLVNYFIEVDSYETGMVTARTYDISREEILMNERTYDLKGVYPYYNTNELIRNE